MGSKKGKDQSTTPGSPPKLDHPFFAWLLGNWQGSTQAPWGNSTDQRSYRWELDGQFLHLDHHSQMEDGFRYYGYGLLTLTPEDEVVGYFFDIVRTCSRGHGKIEGDRLKMEWSDLNGTQVRIIEKVGPDEKREIIRMTMPDEQTVEVTAHYRRMPE